MRVARCAARTSLESGLKYLIIGSVGSATLLYGLALIYGATGSTDFAAIAAAIGDTVGVGDPLLLTGIALAATGLAFKASVAPFHQWTPDVYQGAPTPITAFMAVATKAAAFAIFLRLLRRGARPSRSSTGRPRWPRWRRSRSSSATSARSRSARSSGMLAWSGVAQAGLPARRRRRRHAARRAGDGLLPRRLPADERRRVRGGRSRASASSERGDDIELARGPRPRAARGSPGR